jgi:hypothetical protein
MGDVPLGYDVKDRKLIINEPEALTVRLIFRRYAELGSVSLLRAELDQQDIRFCHHHADRRDPAVSGDVDGITEAQQRRGSCAGVAHAIRSPRRHVANHPLQFNPALRSIADRQDAFSRRTVAIGLKR